MVGSIRFAAETVAEVERIMIFEEYQEEFAFVDKSHTRDAEGNTITTWTQSEATFTAAIRFDNTILAKRAQAEGVEDLYTIICGKETNLEVNDVIKRIETGKTYRVTSSGADNKTPNSASLNMRAVSAKEWVIPDD